MEADAAPLKDEHEDLKGIESRAELVHCYWVAVEDGLVNAAASFENAIVQRRILNLGVDLRTEGYNFSYIVVDGQVVIPNYLQDSVIVDDSLATMTENPGLEDMALQGSGGAEQHDKADQAIANEHHPSTQ